jgi:murein DD-endopeptidase MepM/ murein hydrolase activator NlpD
MRIDRRRLGLTLAAAFLGAREARAEGPNLSSPLRNGSLRSPLPGGILAGYDGDTGLDIGGTSLPVHAIAAGTLDYSERGHTRWVGRSDTAFSVRLALDVPIALGGRRVTHVYYTHMASLVHAKAEGSAGVVRVAAGERLGVSGRANGVPHLHLGLLCDGHVDQASWEHIAREHEIRRLLGGYKNGERLP